MHIAICDDNIADRKHLERLLSRESDKRQGTPNLLYVDSYGDWDNFFHNPFMENDSFTSVSSLILIFFFPLYKGESIYACLSAPNTFTYLGFIYSRERPGNASGKPIRVGRENTLLPTS